MVQPTVRCIRPSQPLSTPLLPCLSRWDACPCAVFNICQHPTAHPISAAHHCSLFFFKSLSFPFHVTHTSLLTTSMFVLFLMLSLQTKWQSYPVDRIIGILSCKRIGADFFFKLSGLTASWKRGIIEYESHNLGNSCMFVIPKVFPTLSEGLKK